MNDERSITALLDEWTALLEKGVPGGMVELYSPSAVLMPTFSDRICRTREDILDYFSNLMKVPQRCAIDEARPRDFGDARVISGVYTFYSDGEGGQATKARFTLVYRKIGEKWLIIEHHSSRFPERLWK